MKPRMRLEVQHRIATGGSPDGYPSKLDFTLVAIAFLLLHTLCLRLLHSCFSPQPTPQSVPLESLQLQAGTVPSVASLRAKADALRAQIAESSQTFEQHIGATPLTAVAMSSDCNPLHDLSAVADYASKASPRAAMTG